MKIILNAKDCTTYPKAYLSIVEQLHTFVNADNVERISINAFFEKHPEIISSLELEIIDSEQFKENLGYKETIRFYKSLTQSSSIEDMASYILNIKNAEKNVGPTLCDDLLELFTKRNINIIFK